MHIRSWWLAVIAVGCVHGNPDPRDLGAEKMARSGLGSWAVVTQHEFKETEGELIATDNGALYMLVNETHELRRFDRTPDLKVVLYNYSIEQELEAWRVLGSLSTLSHGAWLVISLPIWLITTSATINGEMDRASTRYPEEPWEVLGMWARFPQGLPLGIDAKTLVEETATDRTFSRALQLTAAAASAARANDCERVKRLELAMRELDAALHDRVFMHDVSVASCFAPPPPPPDPVPPDAAPDAP
jgi:hypothetical protein